MPSTNTITPADRLAAARLAAACPMSREWLVEVLLIEANRAERKAWSLLMGSGTLEEGLVAADEERAAVALMMSAIDAA